MPFFVLFLSTQEQQFEDAPPSALQRVALQGGPYRSRSEADAHVAFDVAWRQRDLAARSVIDGEPIPVEECRVVEAPDGNTALFEVLDRAPGVEYYLEGVVLPGRSATSMAAEDLPEFRAVQARLRQAAACGEIPEKADFEAQYRLLRQWQRRRRAARGRG
jgi:hypothetical protein